MLMSLLFQMDKSPAAIKPDQRTVKLHNRYVTITQGDFGLEKKT